MPATSESRVNATPAPSERPHRASKPFVLKTKERRLRADGNGAQAKRWLEARDALIESMAPGAHVVDLTPEARTLVEQVADLTLHTDTLRVALLRGEAVDTDLIVRVSVATDRHLATLRKIELLRASTAPAQPEAGSRRVPSPAPPRTPVPTGPARVVPIELPSGTFPLHLFNVPPAATAAHLDALAAQLAQGGDAISRFGHMATTERGRTLTHLEVDLARSAFAQRLLHRIVEEPTT